MDQNRRRRLRAAAAVTGALSAFGAGTYVGSRHLLRRQAAIARRMIGKPLGEQAPAADKVWRKRYGDSLDLLMVGDSIAAGLGAERPKDVLGARLARKSARRLRRSVRLRTVAEVGAETSMLAAQLAELPTDYRPDVAVIVVGGNDVTHRVPVSGSARDLRAVIEWLQARGAHVVVGTCPDLGVLRAVPQPLRALGGRASRQLAAAQHRVALDCGAGSVSLARRVGPFFVVDPEQMFALDRFHPSSEGYRRTAKALLPAVVAGLERRLPDSA